MVRSNWVQTGAAMASVITPDRIEQCCTTLLVVHAVDVHHSGTDEDTCAYLTGCMRAIAEAPYRYGHLRHLRRYLCPPFARVAPHVAFGLLVLSPSPSPLLAIRYPLPATRYLPPCPGHVSLHYQWSGRRRRPGRLLPPWAWALVSTDSPSLSQSHLPASFLPRLLTTYVITFLPKRSACVLVD